MRSVLAAQQHDSLSGTPGEVSPRVLEDWQSNLKAAMDSTTAGSGDELVATGEAAALWADINLDTHIAALFTRVDMPTNPFEIPLQLDNVSWYPRRGEHRHHRNGADHGPPDADRPTSWWPKCPGR